MNWTTRRFPRTSQAEPWRGVVQHYRQPLHVRVAGWIKTAAMLAATFGVLGALLGWGGRSL